VRPRYPHAARRAAAKRVAEAVAHYARPGWEAALCGCSVVRQRVCAGDCECSCHVPSGLDPMDNDGEKS
jgi:hypothetical protein